MARLSLRFGAHTTTQEFKKLMLRAATVSAFVLAISLLAACGSMSSMPMYSQANLSAVVQVPAGNTVAMEAVGVGDTTYQCNAKVAPGSACAAGNMGPRQVVKYQADYIFYKAAM